MTDIKETIQGLYALKAYLASKAIEEHGPARESLIGMQKVVDSAVNLLKEQEEKICSAKEIAMDESTNATWREDSEAWEVLDRIVQKLS